MARTTAAQKAAADARRYGTGQRETGKTPKNPARKEAARRWRVCHLLLDYAVGERVSYDALGSMIAEKQRWRGRPYDQSITYRMETGERQIRIEDWLAMCGVLRDHGVVVDPGWGAFGEKSAAPAPDPQLLQKIGSL